MKTSEPPIIIEQTFPCPVEKVWRAITDPTQMCQWYFEPIPISYPWPELKKCHASYFTPSLYCTFHHQDTDFRYMQEL